MKQTKMNTVIQILTANGTKKRREMKRKEEFTEIKAARDGEKQRVTLCSSPMDRSAIYRSSTVSALFLPHLDNP